MSHFSANEMQYRQTCKPCARGKPTVSELCDRQLMFHRKGKYVNWKSAYQANSAIKPGAFHSGWDEYLDRCFCPVLSCAAVRFRCAESTLVVCKKRSRKGSGLPDRKRIDGRGKDGKRYRFSGLAFLSFPKEPEESKTRWSRGAAGRARPCPAPNSRPKKVGTNGII